MSRPQQGQRIVLLVRVLVGLGMLMVAITIGLIGSTLNRIRKERGLASVEQEQLGRVSDQFRQKAFDSQMEIGILLDETIPRTNTLRAVRDLISLIANQSDHRRHAAVGPSIDQFVKHTVMLTVLAERAEEWRRDFDPIWQDVRQQRTLAQVRTLITQLRGAVEDLDGRHRLGEAIQYRRWRKAGPDESHQLARTILEEQARDRSQGINDFKGDLAECARLVELLGGEEQIDSLADLKDNKLKPAFDRLSRTIAPFGAASTNAGPLTSQSLGQLQSMVFGTGPDGVGLFALRQEALRLRREREKMKLELTAFFHEVEKANAALAQSAQARSAALTQQIESSLAAGWQQMLYVGGGCSALFLWLAWLISRGVGDQVNALDRARAEAVQENVERRQAEEALRKSEAQLQTIVENLAEGVAVFDLNGHLLHFNQAAVAMHGFRSLEDTRIHVTEFDRLFVLADMDGVTLPLDRWPVSRVLRGENLRDVDVRVRRTDEGRERIFSYGGSLVQDAAGRPLMGVVTISDITERKRAESDLEKAHQELITASRMAGMAEVATGVLHNVGNVLNSVNVSATLVADKVKKSRSASVGRIAKMLQEHEADLGVFLSTDPKGRQLPAFLATLAEHLGTEQAALTDELAQLQKNIQHIKDVVAMQQSYAKVSGVTETLAVSELLEDTLRMNFDSISKSGVNVVREFEDVPDITVDKHKLLQILVNLVRNAKHACEDAGHEDRRITLRVAGGDERVFITVSDNGVGIPSENLNRIFNHGFTTKKDGHGFGLHSGANAAKEMGGSLTVQSAGAGHGATFTLELPVAPIPRRSLCNPLTEANTGASW